MGEIIDGKATAATIRSELTREISSWVAAGHATPGLATVLVGDDPASAVYITNKQRACAEVGIDAFDHRLSANVSHGEVASLVERLNADSTVSGILVQLPT